MAIRLVLYLLVAATLAFGAPYAAAVLSRVQGPWSADALEQDGTRTHMQFATELPRPDWVPVYPGALIAQASNLTSARFPSGVQSLDISTRDTLSDIKRFYTARLEDAGFKVRDLGRWPMDARTAAFIGLDSTLYAERAATDDRITIQIHSPEGILSARLLQLQWRKISETPAWPLAGGGAGEPGER
jgi:hypothetical protein